MKPYNRCEITTLTIYNVIFNSLHNSLQFFYSNQIHLCPWGTSPLGHCHLQLHSEGMSKHLHLPQTSRRLWRGATGTWHTQWIHHRQQGGGQWLNSVYMVSVVVKCCVTVGFVGTVYIEFHINSSLWCMQYSAYVLHTAVDTGIDWKSYTTYGLIKSYDKLQN